MADYVVAFNDEWVPDLTDDELRERSADLRPLLAETRAAGVLIFTGGLNDGPVVGVGVVDGRPVFADGPVAETDEHLGGFAVIDVTDAEAARHWAGRIAVACGWPQELRRFRTPLPPAES